MAAAAVLVCGVGCDKADPLVEVSPAEKVADGLAADARESMVAAARGFAEDLRAARGGLVAQRFDLGAFVREVLQGLPVSRQVWEEFEAAVRAGLEDLPGGLLADSIGQDFRFLRLVEVEGTTQMLFRVWDEAAGVNYLRGVVDRPGGDGWKLVDMFSYSSGETLSESMRRTYLPLLVGESGGELDDGERRLLRAGYKEFQRAVAAFHEGDYAAARREFATVPVALREQRFGRVLEIEILSRDDVEPQAYADALEAFGRAFPGDPSLPLMMLEHHSLRGEHEQALARIDEIEALLGGDEFLHFLRAGALSGLGREAEAVVGLRRAIAAEPQIEELRWALVLAALPAGEHALVAETLLVLKTDFEYEFSAEQLQAAEAYEDFVESPEGMKVLAELRGDG